MIARVSSRLSSSRRNLVILQGADAHLRGSVGLSARAKALPRALPFKSPPTEQRLHHIACNLAWFCTRSKSCVEAKFPRQTLMVDPRPAQNEQHITQPQPTRQIDHPLGIFPMDIALGHDLRHQDCICRQLTSPRQQRRIVNLRTQIQVQINPRIRFEPLSPAYPFMFKNRVNSDGVSVAAGTKPRPPPTSCPR